MHGPRLLVHVEGQTEEVFVNEVLRPHLVQQGYSLVSARLLGSARRRDRRGGIRGWSGVRGDIVRHLRGDPGCIATTMVDYYALPASGGRAWPGRAHATLGTTTTTTAGSRADAVEEALIADIRGQMGSAFDPRRFIPFVAMHEYEALLFSDCDTLASSLGDPSLATPLSEIRAAFATPEEINDSPQTAPSKRIESLVERYEKPFHGVMALLEIGLPKVRAQCPHFDAWVRQLEMQAPATP